MNRFMLNIQLEELLSNGGSEEQINELIGRIESLPEQPAPPPPSALPALPTSLNMPNINRWSLPQNQTHNNLSTLLSSALSSALPSVTDHGESDELPPLHDSDDDSSDDDSLNNDEDDIIQHMYADTQNNSNPIGNLLTRNLLLHRANSLRNEANALMNRARQIATLAMSIQVPNAQIISANDLMNMLRDGMEDQPVSLDSTVLEQIGIKKYKSEEENKFTSCCVCMTDFENDDEIRDCPCSHVYHVGCIDEWFKQKPTCPVCRKDMRDYFKEQSSPSSSTSSSSSSSTDILPPPPPLTD